MPGIATRLVVAQRVFNQLGASNNGVAIVDGVTLDSAWFMFGAVGPAIGDFVSAGPNATGGTTTSISPFMELWQMVLNLVIGPPAAPGAVPTGLVPNLQALQSLLAQVKNLVDNKDFDGMQNLNKSGALNNVATYIQNLTNTVNQFQDLDNLKNIGQLIGTAPLIDNAQYQAPEGDWTGREWLHWKRPGDFASTLLSNARKSGDARFISYALGWQVAYATLVCGSDFVNSIVGSSYRTYWWRYRWVSNFVDAWAWGFYGSGAKLDSNGNPVFPNAPATGVTDYASWPSLCNASLHQKIDVTGGAFDGLTVAYAVVQNYLGSGSITSAPPPLIASGSTPGLIAAPLPGDFADFWIQSWQQAYAQDIVAGSPPLFTQQGLQIAYLMTWLMLWFQTSGQVIGCLPAVPAAPPDPSCDGSQYANQMTSSIPGQGSPSDLKPTPAQKTDVGKTICGVILAIFGVVSGIFTAAALAEIIGGIALIVNGIKQLNWSELECQLYWDNQFIYSALLDLHQVAVLAGLQYPYASDLDSGSWTSITFGPESASYQSGAQTCQSRVLRSMLQPWIPYGTDLSTVLANLFTSDMGQSHVASWTDYPQNGAIETPLASGPPPWEIEERWPPFFIDDTAKNPGTASILKAPAQYNTGITGGTAPPSFGSAVPTALAIIHAAPPTLPNWNLDGDRSLGWLTWQLTGPYVVPVVNIQPES